MRAETERGRQGSQSTKDHLNEAVKEGISEAMNALLSRKYNRGLRLQRPASRVATFRFLAFPLGGPLHSGRHYLR